jgi:hypothetical protein
MRPFFELNPVAGRPPSGADGVVDLGPFFPGAYDVRIQAGQQSARRHVSLGWGEQVDLEFDLGQDPLTIAVHLPDEWLDRLFQVEYRALGDEPQHGLMIPALRLNRTTFQLCAPPSRGYVALSLQRGWDSCSLCLPLTVRAGIRAVDLELPAGEILIDGGPGRDALPPPSVCVVELATGKIPDEDTKYGTVPLEPLPGGRWLARGIPENSTVRIRGGDQRIRVGEGEKLVRFESGRLEVSWP